MKRQTFEYETPVKKGDIKGMYCKEHNKYEAMKYEGRQIIESFESELWTCLRSGSTRSYYLGKVRK